MKIIKNPEAATALINPNKPGRTSGSPERPQKEQSSDEDDDPLFEDDELFENFEEDEEDEGYEINDKFMKQDLEGICK